MSQKPLVSILGLSLLSIMGFLALYGVSLRNGMLEEIRKNIQSSRPTLPGTDIPLWTKWTGLALVDLDFNIMNSVFAVILDANNLSLFVQGSHFFGLWMSFWVLVLLESHLKRPRNASKSYVIWGLVMEFVAVGIASPAWCAFNLLQFTPLPKGGRDEARNVPRMESRDLSLLFWSYLVGLGIPTLGMIITSLLRISSSQTWILIRLFHPALVFLVHRLLLALQPWSTQCSENDPNYAMQLKRVYKTAFWLSAGPHLLVVAAISAAHFFPSLLPPNVAESLSPGSIWPIGTILQGFSTKTATIQSGVATFMTGNELISSIAIVLWAWTVNRAALREVESAQHMRLGLLKLVGIALAFGLGAAAVVLVQNRDDICEHRLSSDYASKQM